MSSQEHLAQVTRMVQSGMGGEVGGALAQDLKDQDMLEAHVTRIYRQIAISSVLSAEAIARNKDPSGRRRADGFLDPKRLPDPSVMTMLRKATEIRLKQVPYPVSVLMCR